MDEHPQLVANAIELRHGVTIIDRWRLWQELSDALNHEVLAQEWQAWWRRPVREARRDTAAIRDAQTGTVWGWLPGFRGQVLQLTGMTRFSGVFGLTYQQQANVPTAAVEMDVEATEAAVDGSDTVTRKHLRT
ncbi:uncharacterized protein LOC142774355 [Rhipicephalus microplus]|uniref:uncharacterized protein LOC142774355 n=1 Tax=Rhipicephalus microplus TaxID=6941 RepID=UPI003F6BF13D